MLGRRTRASTLLWLALTAAAAALAVPAAAAREVAHPRGPAAGVVVTRVGIGALRPGQTLAQAQRAWGKPDLTLTRRGLVSYRWRNGDGMLAYVRGRGGRVETIEVEGPVFRTARGDGYGTKLSVFRRHWRDAKRYPSCCSAEVSHYTVPAAQRGKLLVFSFWRGFGLRRVALTSEASFRACYVSECD